MSIAIQLQGIVSEKITLVHLSLLQEQQTLPTQTVAYYVKKIICQQFLGTDVNLSLICYHTSFYNFIY